MSLGAPVERRCQVHLLQAACGDVVFQPLIGITDSCTLSRQSSHLMPRSTNLAVCFADIQDSTSLFETHGDDRARNIVDRTLTLTAEVTQTHDGTVVKSLGDGLMCTFPELSSAAHATARFLQVVEEDETLASLGIELRGGFCYGMVLQEEDGDVFGDAVNTASRLAEWAHADQVVTTARTRDALPEYLQNQTRSLGETVLRGKEKPVEVVELLIEKSESDLTVAEDPARDAMQEKERVLRMCHQGEHFTVRQGPLWLGRSTEADLRIDDSRVSRMHAVIDKQRDVFQIADQSTNGTHVRLGGDEDALFLHHDQLHLHGTGYISLGWPIGSNEAHRLRFENIVEPFEG